MIEMELFYHQNQLDIKSYEQHGVFQKGQFPQFPEDNHSAYLYGIFLVELLANYGKILPASVYIGLSHSEERSEIAITIIFAMQWLCL